MLTTTKLKSIVKLNVYYGPLNIYGKQLQNAKEVKIAAFTKYKKNR